MTKDNEQEFKKVAMSEYEMKYATGVPAAADKIINCMVDLAIAVRGLIFTQHVRNWKIKVTECILYLEAIFEKGMTSIVLISQSSL